LHLHSRALARVTEYVEGDAMWRRWTTWKKAW
jgi:hypothetical protein